MSGYTYRHGAEKDQACFVRNPYGYSGPATIVRCASYEERNTVCAPDGTIYDVHCFHIFLSEPVKVTVYDQWGMSTGYEEGDMRYR